MTELDLTARFDWTTMILMIITFALIVIVMAWRWLAYRRFMRELDAEALEPWHMPPRPSPPARDGGH